MALSSSVTEYIVETVTVCENASPDQLPPLAEKIGSETFQQLASFESELTQPLTFEYLFYEVTVLPDGEVSVSPEATRVSF